VFDNEVGHDSVGQVLEKLFVFCENLVSSVSDIDEDLNQLDTLQACLILLNIILLINFSQQPDNCLDTRIIDHPHHPPIINLKQFIILRLFLQQLVQYLDYQEGQVNVRVGQETHHRL
jgi:hypothetical protein